MVRLVADQDVCVGAGMCALTAPDLFEQDADEGLVVVKVDSLGDAELQRARNAVDLCPSGALSLQHDDRRQAIRD
jgi:ferredoxin